MASAKLYHDQKLAAGEHVRIWHSESEHLFEHVFPTGQSISIRCESLDEARSLLARSVDEGLESDVHILQPRTLFGGEGGP